MPSWSLFVLLVGVIAYAFADAGEPRSKVATVGRIMFAMGLLAWLIANGARAVSG